MASTGSSPDKRTLLRYAGTCRLCARPLGAGSDAVYERPTRTVRCVTCVIPEAAAGAAAVDEDGVAGASARREYERRRDSRETRIRTAHPKLGGLILALSDEPQSTDAWQRGTVGEELMAARLKDLPDTFRVLHDRRIPGTRANIDHLAIGPSGVWVIDAKRYKAKRPELRVEGGIIRPRVESLRIGGRDGTKLVQGVRKQVALVRAVVSTDIPVHGVLCFIEGDWPLFGGPFRIDDVRVTWPRALVKAMTTAEQDAAVDVAGVRTLLATRFPPA